MNRKKYCCSLERSLASLPRAALLALAVLGVFLAAAAPAHALPPQGMYEGCSPGSTAASVEVCNERLRALRAAGITIVLNYSALYGDSQRIREYAAEAQRLGMRMIWPLHHPNLRRTRDVRPTYTALTTECGCSSPADFVPFAVRFLRDLPATYAYYVGDEVPLSEHDALKAVSDLVRQADAAHPRFYVAVEFANFGDNLEPFADVAEILAGDHYPIGLGDDVSGVGSAMAGVQRVADRAHKPAAIVLQSFSWASYGFGGAPWPTREQYRRMLEQALGNGQPRFVMWWAYYRIAADPDPAARWDDFKAGVFDDRIVPNAVITSRPARRTSSTRAAFAFTSPEAETSFECRLDHEGWAPCSSPHSLTVAEGEHDFGVRAIDHAGYAGPPSTAHWTVGPADGRTGRGITPDLQVGDAIHARSSLSYRTRRARTRALERRCAHLRLAASGVCRRRASRIRNGRPEVSFSADRRGTVRITLRRGQRRLMSVAVRARAGRNRWHLRGNAYRRLAPRSYRVTISTPASSAATRLQLR